MKRLLVALLFTTALYACSDNPVDPVDEENWYRVGTFKVFPDDRRADWEGMSKSKALSYSVSSAGTTYVAQPESNGLTMEYDSLKKVTVARFTDSTLTQNDYNIFETSVTAEIIDGDTLDYNNAIEVRGFGSKQTDDYVQAKFTFYVRCDGSGEPPTDIIITVADSSFSKTWQLPVNGLDKAARDIGC